MSLEVKNLSYSYNGKDVILKGLNFLINQGECVAVIGSNGVGKTTLMKCILNMLKIEKNTVFIDEKDIKDISKKELAKIISYVPQNISFPSASVFESILIGRIPYINFSPNHEDLKMVDMIIKELNLSSICFKNVNDLSGGQKQKVAIARAMVQEAKLMYFDEPTSNLDIKNQIEIIRIMKKIANIDKKIILMNLQDINFAIKYFDKIMVLNDGRIEFFGSPDLLNEKILSKSFNVNIKMIKNKNQSFAYIDEEF